MKHMKKKLFQAAPVLVVLAEPAAGVLLPPQAARDRAMTRARESANSRFIVITSFCKKDEIFCRRGDGANKRK